MSSKEIINVDDVFLDRPKLNTPIYLLVMGHAVILWGVHTVRDNPSMLLTAWLMLAITLAISYPIWLLLAFKQREKNAIGKYMQHLVSLDKAQLRHLLNDSRLRPFSQNIVNHHYAVRFGIDKPD